MKRIITQSLILLFLLANSFSVVSANRLFSAAFVLNKNNTGGNLIIRKNGKSNFRYQKAGILLSSHGFTFAEDNKGCQLNLKNGWCMFSIGNEPVTLKLSRRLFAPAPNLTPSSINGVGREMVAFKISPNASETALSVQSMNTVVLSPGRVIGYLYGWETPPSPSDIAAAGYTHVLIAFGLFSTSAPGTINIDAISGISNLNDYIQSLHNSGLKVLLSIGGASTSISNTTVDFNQAVSMSSSPATFISTFVNNMASLVSTYGFDGFDFDIEQGLNANNQASSTTTFTDPGYQCSTSVFNSNCDIYYLATIINSYYAQYGGMLTLVPQIANISATSGFSSTWGNYASLVMQTYSALEWVAFQNYNSGCAYGVNLVCYPTDNNTLTSTQDPAVAFSTDLLATWPAYLSTGQATGFLPYTAYLSAQQVVIGYVVNNLNGQSDGSPSVNQYLTQAIDAIQCLRNGEECDTFNPYKTYPGWSAASGQSIGGVFSWTINYDATNNYQFVKTMYPCVVDGNCSTN